VADPSSEALKIRPLRAACQGRMAAEPVRAKPWRLGRLGVAALAAP